jgi:hypothetical protein
MKLVLAALIHQVLALILCTGVVLMVAGKPWLLSFAFPLYVVAFGKIGCRSQH